MHITPKLLMDSARKAANDILMHSEDILCIYLTGSLLEEQPLIGGTTDIDLICVHSFKPPVARELKPITDEFHLDIAHYPQSRYGQARDLRQDAWLGSFLVYKPVPLHDSQHWFEFTQSGVFAQFLQPAYIIQRARPFIQSAREIWLALNQQQPEPDPQTFWEYLKSLELAGNALACLVGVPLTDRRFFQDLPARTEALERPGLSAGLADLFQSEDGKEVDWDTDMQEWAKCILAANEKKNCPIHLNTLRIPYYEKAILEYSVACPQAGLWLLLRTWTQALTHLPKRSPEIKPWQSVLQSLNLDKPHFPARLQALDSYLEAVEETVETWAANNGV